MKPLKYVSLLAITGIIFACDLSTELELNMPAPKSRLVTNCFFGADSTWIVRVYGSVHTLDVPPEQGPVVTNADVRILAGSHEVRFTYDTLRHFYRPTLNVKAEIGHTYLLEVSSPGFETVRSSVTVPTPVPVMDAFTYKLPPDDEYAAFVGRVRIRFADPAEQRNYYAVSVRKIFHRTETYDYRSELIIQPADETLSDQYVAAQITFANQNTVHPIFFDDQLFDGKEHTIEVSYSQGLLFNPNTDDVTYHVTLWAVSEEYYRYRLTIRKQNEQFKDPFAQPVQVVNNIENGFGVFGAFSHSTYEFKADF